MSKFVKGLLILVIIIILASIVVNNYDYLTQNPFNRTQAFQDPLVATEDSNKNVYMIDNAMKRIVKLDKAGSVRYVINGGQRKAGSFFYAIDLANDLNGNLYVLNEILDQNSYYVDSEEILKFDSKGNFVKVVYKIDYEEGNKPVRKGRLSSMKVDGENIYVYSKTGDAYNFIKVSANDSSYTVLETVQLKDAEILIIDFATSLNPFYTVFTTKRGEIFKVVNGVAQMIYKGTGNNNADMVSIPWEVEIDSMESIIFTDIGISQIRKIDEKGKRSVLLSKGNLTDGGYDEGNAVFYRISVNADSVVTVNNGSIAVVDDKGSISNYLSSGMYSIKDLAFKLIPWLSAIILLIILMFIARLFYIKVMRKKVSVLLLQGLFVIFIVMACAALVSNIIFTSFTSRYEKEVFNRISQTIQLMSKNLDGDYIGNITGPENFYDKDYIKIREKLHSSFNNNEDEWNSSFYGAIYKVVNDKLYVVMYYDDSVSTFYPISDEYIDSEYYQAYMNGKITTIKDSDAEGDWMYGVGPIYNSNGKIAGVLEVGSDLYGFKEANIKLIKKIVLDTGTILVVLILFLIETTMLVDIMAQRKKNFEVSGEKLTGIETKIVRPIGFIVFTAAFMSAAFIPLMAKSIYKPIMGLPENVVIGLPISAEALFMAISALLGGYLVDKKGWKPSLIGGLAILLLGQLLSGMAWEPLQLILARGVSGIGFGLSLISMQSFVILPSSEHERNEGIISLNSGSLAGLNCGAVAGAIIADRIGYSKVFFISVFLLIIALAFVLKLSVNYIAIKDPGEEKISKKPSILKFLFDFKVLMFFLFAFIPITICGMFLAYFFPIFAEGQGVTASGIGSAFLLNGLLIIYLGPVLSKYILRYVSAGTALFIAGIVAVIALLQFSIQGTLLSAYITIIMLGIGDSFGVASQVNYFSSLKAVRNMGEGKAMGYYGLVENFGQVIGPISYGIALSLGVVKGISILGIILIACMLVFSLSIIPGVLYMKKAYRETPNI